MNSKILIIDDEKWFFEPILEILKSENIDFDFCKDGTCALKKLKTDSYKTIVLDMKVSLGKDLLHLMGEDVPGISILREIKKISSHIPVLCWTVLSDADIKNKVEALGGKYFLKAGNEEDLIKEIKYIVKKAS